MTEKKNSRPIPLLWDLFLTFFQIGSFTFGGGYAMISLIEREVAHRKKWVQSEDIVDIFAIAESVPGAIAINSSTFIGYKIAGIKGAVLATLGVVLPSFLIITIIAAFFARFQDNPLIKAAFMGVRTAVTALILTAAYKIGKTAIRDRIGVVISVCVILLAVFTEIKVVFLIAAGGLLGILICQLRPDILRKLSEDGVEKN